MHTGFSRILATEGFLYGYLRACMHIFYERGPEVLKILLGNLKFNGKLLQWLIKFVAELLYFCNKTTTKIMVDKCQTNFSSMGENLCKIWHNLCITFVTLVYIICSNTFAIAESPQIATLNLNSQ